MPTQVSKISAQLSPLLHIFFLSLAEGSKPWRESSLSPGAPHCSGQRHSCPHHILEMRHPDVAMEFIHFLPLSF